MGNIDIDLRHSRRLRHLLLLPPIIPPLSCSLACRSSLNSTNGVLPSCFLPHTPLSQHVFLSPLKLLDPSSLSLIAGRYVWPLPSVLHDCKWVGNSSDQSPSTARESCQRFADSVESQHVRGVCATWFSAPLASLAIPHVNPLHWKLPPSRAFAAQRPTVPQVDFAAHAAQGLAKILSSVLGIECRRLNVSHCSSARVVDSALHSAIGQFVAAGLDKLAECDVEVGEECYQDQA